MLSGQLWSYEWSAEYKYLKLVHSREYVHESKRSLTLSGFLGVGKYSHMLWSLKSDVQCNVDRTQERSVAASIVEVFVLSCRISLVSGLRISTAGRRVRSTRRRIPKWQKASHPKWLVIGCLKRRARNLIGQNLEVYAGKFLKIIVTV